ncbi:hypothetical protein GQR60_17445 [Labilibaculum sp. A4]|uniref:hypothetical protein n=1 Tax=Labilibaculum euxinus TaxID=2686357 RepID=UPI000F627AD7|nr:hypothetical protein [Labilibaculum euxinus]MDQ1772418.1 hypothetical protein [Labilibaculum euxinus]MWN78122.1 hypothetical protein [Labilibaculum euxinus]
MSSVLTFGCQNKKPSADKIPEITAPQQKEFKSVKTLFYNVPSPIEVTGIIKKMNLPYQPDLMNPVSNADNYLSQADVAINIGIYGADLSYIRIYEQFQDAARYLAVIKKFTRDLGIPEEQERITARRMEENIENQDSLLQIITETFTKSDSYLKENQRGGVAALIVFGGWIETLYLATNIVDLKNPQKEMVNLISQQKHSVKNLIGLLNQYRDNYKINQILPDLKKLDAKFQEISQTKSSASSIKTKDGKTVIKNQVTLTASNETIREIKEINSKIRETITEL